MTGFLHREGDFFLQYIEGPKEALCKTVARIGRDTRQEDFNILKFEKCDHLLLPDWSMGFIDPSRLSLADVLETTADGLDVKGVDPFDLVVFLVSNAQALHSKATQA